MGVKLAYGQVQRSAMNWPFFAAAALGLFAEENLSVEPTIFFLPPEPVAGLIEGELDIINVIPDVALLEMVKGAHLSIIANTNIGSQYRLMVRGDIGSFEDLEGKKIGVNDGRSAEALILIRLLAQKGLGHGSYELVPSGRPPERCRRLREGLLAATMVTQPFDFGLEHEGFKCLASALEAAPHYPFTVCVIRRDRDVNENFVGFLKSLKRAWRWLADPANRKGAVAILGRSTETSEREAEATYDLYFSSSAPPSLAPAEEGVATVLELLADSGRLTRPLPAPRGFIDRRYFEKLNKES